MRVISKSGARAFINVQIVLFTYTTFNDDANIRFHKMRVTIRC